jgi:hypothetical protein
MLSRESSGLRIWTPERFAPLEAAGAFRNERLELVEGELISKMGKNRPHVNAFRLMLIWLQKTFGEQFVDPEAPIDVSAADNNLSEPEPGLIVLNRPCGTILSGNPQPRDISLLVSGGRYSSVLVYSEHECVAPLAAPDASLCAADVLAQAGTV